jgi:Zn-dependent protease with chaperone function
MGFESGSSVLGVRIENVFSSVIQQARALLGYNDFSPEETLAEAKNIDPRLVPKVPMQSTDIDANLLVELGKMGMKRGKLVTAESHPELMQAWKTMSTRAGLSKTPQLIIVESKIVNAMTVSPEEVVVTTGLLRKLDLREVNAVLGHELAHANSDHRRPRIAANVIFSTLGALVAHKLWHGSPRAQVAYDSPLTVALDEVLSLMVGASAGTVLANQIAVKPTELQADLKGAVISGDPQGLINALTKLEAGHKKRPLLSFFSGLYSGYPTTEQRIHNLQTIAAHMPAVKLAPALTALPEVPAAGRGPGVQVTQVAADARVEAVPTHVALG